MLLDLLSVAVGKGIVVEGMMGSLYLVAYCEENHVVSNPEVTHTNKAILVSWSSAETKGRYCQCVAASDSDRLFLSGNKTLTQA